jgi:hypothetical protein
MQVKIPLERPLVGHGKTIAEVVVREPTYAEYMELGDPFVVALSPGEKIPFMVEDKAVLAAYCAKLVVEPADQLLLAQGGHKLARKIAATVRGFFLDGAEATEASETSPTTSSSPSEKNPTRSGV